MQLVCAITRKPNFTQVALSEHLLSPEANLLLGKRLLILKTQYQTRYYFLLSSSLKISVLTDSMIKYIPKRLFLSILSAITVPEIHGLSFSELVWRSILSRSCTSV